MSALSKLVDLARLPALARQVRAEGLTYLSPAKLRSLVACIDRVARDGVAGDVLEMGVALGGSAILLAARMGERRLVGYDVFGLIPPPTEADGEDAHRRFARIEAGESRGLKGRTYYGYRDDLLADTTAAFARHGQPVDGTRIALVAGLFEDTLPETGGPVALAHIDCDWHDPVALCLARIGPRVSPGGLIVLDDYADYEGCRRATDAFLQDAPFVREQAAPHAVLRCTR
ncbi:MAG: TylF/MycF/NovP-related O-methyltransferase [Pseudomonadota bacterium]